MSVEVTRCSVNTTRPSSYFDFIITKFFLISYSSVRKNISHPLHSNDGKILLNPGISPFILNQSSPISQNRYSGRQKMWNASRFCVSSLRRGHANLLCIVPILVYVQPKLNVKLLKFSNLTQSLCLLTIS